MVFTFRINSISLSLDHEGSKLWSKMKNHLPIKAATIVINTEVIIFLIVKTENIRQIVLVHCSFSDFTLAKKIVYLNSILFGNSESTE